MTDEQAKATQEVAKTSGQLIEASQKVGGFISRIVGGASNQLGGMLEDSAKLYRYKNLLNIADTVKAIHTQRRIDGKSIPIPLRLAIPMLDSAALEDDETLQQVWARLIANSTDPNFKEALHPGYVEIIKQISPDEVIILNSFLKIQNYPNLFINHISGKNNSVDESFWLFANPNRRRQIASYDGICELYLEYCKGLPLKRPTGARVYLDNLQRLQIVELGHDFSGKEKNDSSGIFGRRQTSSDKNPPTISIPARDEYLRMTTFGKSFVEACINA